MKALLLYIIVLFSSPDVGRKNIVEEFKPACDSLSTLIMERNTVKGELKINKVLIRRNTLDFYFNESLGDYPWRKEDISWFRDKLKELLPQCYAGYSVGEIYSRNVEFGSLAMPEVRNDGKPVSSRHRIRQQAGRPLVTQEDGMRFTKGLSGRHIAIWQSHGRYYEQSLGRWEWQRPCLFQTVEDLMSAGFVLPYLVPMIENAGGYVMLPRERDTNPNEIILDNDHGPMSVRQLPATSRNLGTYTEYGTWRTEAKGFADTLEIIYGKENPFEAGSSRVSPGVPDERNKGFARAVWTPEIQESGEYAVYVSYVTTPTSTESARYTVNHAAGQSVFTVNQKMGGGTWVYLGTFPFRKDGTGSVTLDNAVPKGSRFVSGSTVSADAVRFGGGMGNIARRHAHDSCSVSVTSGFPRYAEGARYWLQWAGTDSTIYSQDCGENDYADDFMCRGDWVGYLAGGSRHNMATKGKNIPIDLAFAFHSDAGITPNDSLIGTLSIYTLTSERKRTYPSGSSRMAGREYADIVQSQVVCDMRSTFDKDWNRRSIWDRSYRESRTPPVPAMLLESFSHQNFADMRYALDPTFRFTLCRAVYKGILKFLSNRYGTDYVVQPLPVRSFSVEFADNDKARLYWRPTTDSLESTAGPKGYILYTRVDSGVFDQGRVIDDITAIGDMVSTSAMIEPGHIYSFKVVAFNDGGMSFPSEILSIGRPHSPSTGNGDHQTGKEGSHGADMERAPVLIVNNFTRLSAPAWFDTPQYAGFDNRLDSGVPYINDCSFVGEMHQFRRDMPWFDDDNPGFGASYQDHAGKPVAGNTFDYPYIHGKALMKAGFPFYSSSAEAFAGEKAIGDKACAIDIICGKQVTTPVGVRKEKTRYTIFDKAMQEAIRNATASGKSILVSGSHIGTDIWDRVYPVQADSTFRAMSIEFAQRTLGYRWRANHATRTGSANAVPPGSAPDRLRFIDLYGALPSITFRTVPNEDIYSVETPDGIEPYDATKARTFVRYSDSGVSAGVCYDAGDYKAICLGFPIEVISDAETRDSIIGTIFKYFCL